jgi:hypothetical protein
MVVRYRGVFSHVEKIYKIVSLYLRQEENRYVCQEIKIHEAYPPEINY